MDAWEAFVDSWLSPEWHASHEAARERRMMMPGPSHHQGSVPLATYAARYSAAHGGEPVSTFAAWGLAHKGKATTPGLVFNVDDGPEVYTNTFVHEKMHRYVGGAKAVHGADFDPTTQPIDADVVMKVGGGRRHGRHLIADGSISGSKSLSQLRAESTSGSLPIRDPPTAAQHMMSSLQSQLTEERRARAESERAAAERERILHENMASLRAYLEAQALALNRPPPPNLVMIAPPPFYTPQHTPVQSGASNSPGMGGTPPPTLPAPQSYTWPYAPGAYPPQGYAPQGPYAPGAYPSGYLPPPGAAPPPPGPSQPPPGAPPPHGHQSM